MSFFSCIEIKSNIVPEYTNAWFMGCFMDVVVKIA